MKPYIFALYIVAHFSLCQAQVFYQNDFEASSDLNDFTIHSNLPGWWVGMDYRPVMTGQTAYLNPGDPPPGGSLAETTFTLNSNLEKFANFKNSGDVAKISLWHFGTGSESAGFDFFQFLGFVPDTNNYYPSGKLLGVYGDHSDYALGPGGELGTLLNGVQRLITGPFGDSGAPSWDDESWNRFSAKFEYVASSNEMIVSGGILNYGPTGTSAPILIATLPETILSADGFDNQKLLPSFGFNATTAAGKEAYDRFQFEFQSVPEPSSMIMVGTVILPILLCRKRTVRI